MEKMMSLNHLFVTTFIGSLSMFMVIPSIVDITMEFVCPHQDHCSIAIYLSGLQQAIVGLGAVVITPVIGNLSDRYGRKAMLTIPMTFSIIPLAIMGYRRTTNFFYAFYIMKTLTDMVSEGTTVSLALAYVADKTSEDQRISAFGILSGVRSVGYVCGTFLARLLSTATVFQVAAFMSVLAVVHMRIFLKESIPDQNELTQPIFDENLSGGDDENGPELPTRTQLSIGMSPIRDVISLITSSTTFSQAARVSFFNSLAEKGMQASLAYFLKARFHFDKNQFADLMIIEGVAGAVSLFLLMPALALAIRQERLLSIGLWASIINILLNSIAWSVWVPYALRAFTIFTILVSPIVSFPCFLQSLSLLMKKCRGIHTNLWLQQIFNIASSQVGPSEQGKAQGYISGINSLANIAAPLLFSPLIALFLSKDAPFDFPGFGILCIGLASVRIQNTSYCPLPMFRLPLYKARQYSSKEH
ncbi:Hippocampus abundant transcript 1 protein, partial [Cucurbita argyrosperma subsp. argyrosperma]